MDPPLLVPVRAALALAVCSNSKNVMLKYKSYCQYYLLSWSQGLPFQKSENGWLETSNLLFHEEDARIFPSLIFFLLKRGPSCLTTTKSLKSSLWHGVFCVLPSPAAPFPRVPRTPPFPWDPRNAPRFRLSAVSGAECRVPSAGPARGTTGRPGQTAAPWR